MALRIDLILEDSLAETVFSLSFSYWAISNTGQIVTDTLDKPYRNIHLQSSVKSPDGHGGMFVAVQLFVASVFLLWEKKNDDAPDACVAVAAHNTQYHTSMLNPHL